MKIQPLKFKKHTVSGHIYWYAGDAMLYWSFSIAEIKSNIFKLRFYTDMNDHGEYWTGTFEKLEKIANKRHRHHIRNCFRSLCGESWVSYETPDVHERNEK